MTFRKAALTSASWAVASYFVGNSNDVTVTNLLAVLATVIAILGDVACRRRTEAWSVVVRLGVGVPCLVGSVTVMVQSRAASRREPPAASSVLGQLVESASRIAVGELSVLVVAWGHAMLGLHFWLRVRPWYARIRELALVTAVLVPVLFGLSFQTPLVMLFLAKIGIFDADSFRSKRKIAWFSTTSLRHCTPGSLASASRMRRACELQRSMSSRTPWRPSVASVA